MRNFCKIGLINFLFILSIFSMKCDARQIRECFYAGFGVGGSFDHVDLTTRNEGTLFTVSENADGHQPIATAFLGFGHTFCNVFYLGAELGTYFPGHSADLTRQGVTVLGFLFKNRLRANDYLTGDILLGFRPCCRSLFYIRGGGSWARIRFHQFANEIAGTPSFGDRATKAGGRIGAGINYALTNCIGLGLDYVYTSYQKFHTFVALFNQSFDIRMHSHYFGISTIYSF